MSVKKVLTVVIAMRPVPTWWEATAARALTALVETVFNVKVRALDKICLETKDHWNFGVNIKKGFVTSMCLLCPTS